MAGAASADASAVATVKAVRCSVDGQEVEALWLQFYTPQFLVADEYGSNEISRVHFSKQNRQVDEPFFSCGVWGANMVGSATIDAVRYNTREGLDMEFKNGYRAHIGPTHCRATWKLK